MKSALVLEKDVASRKKISKMLGWLGYVTAPVSTADEAFNAVHAISFDVIVTCTAEKPHDRRSLTGELKRAAPEAAVVLIPESNQENTTGQSAKCTGVSAVLKRPVSIVALRRVVEFGIDGYGLQPAYRASTRERRKNYS